MSIRPASLARSVRVAAAVLLVGFLTSPAHALHRESPGAMRLTFGGAQTIPETHSWGNNFGFATDTDLLGNGSTGRHIFIWNLAYFDCNNHTTRPTTPCPNPPLPALVQLEHRPGSPSNPSVNFDGSLVAFEADGSFNGNTGSDAHHRQIFIMNTVTGEILQMTRSPDHDSIRPSLNRGGSIVVFESRAPLGGRTDLAGIPQIFAYHRLTKQFAQLTYGRGPSHFPIPNAGGSRISFESTADLLGNGRDTGVSQIFVSILDPTSFSNTLVQITKGDRPSRHAYIAEKSVDMVVFESTATDLTGSDGDGTSQVYSAPTGEGNLPLLTPMTNRAEYGDCFNPVLDVSSSHIGFMCTGDPLENGTTGKRLFAIDLAVDPANPATPRLYQLTGRGDPQGLLRHNLGQWFLAFIDRVDRTGTGTCDYQLQVLDYYPGHWNAATQKGSLPPDLLPPNPFPAPESNQIGARSFVFAPGDATGGSQLAISSRAGLQGTGTIGRGEIGVSILPRSVDGVAAVAVPALATGTSIPPITVTGLGTICLALTEDGAGTIDCMGGQPGGDLETSQDHDIGDLNPGCVGGCFERGACQGSLPGPHKGTCNGAVTFTHSGTYVAGGLTLRLPLAVGVARDAGVDGFWCTADDTYTFRDLPSVIELTTGTNTSTIVDADNAPGASFGAVDRGIALDCARLKNEDLTGAELVGSLPILDVPTADGVRDLLVRLRLQARPPLHPPQVCRTGPCVLDTDCDDANLCNGIETCVGRTCVGGTPIVCDDGDTCNGTETCHPSTGVCQAGRRLDCNDDNPCTDEGCNPGVGCVHGNNSGSCDDEDACTQGDSCHNGACHGTPFVRCDDGDPCNGAETCDPESGECADGSPPSCSDKNPCTDDACSPALGCLHTNNTAPCNDQSNCTTDDVCRAGTCTGTSLAQCDDGNACNGVETCNPVSGACVAGVTPDCDDETPCTADSCSPGARCVHTPIAGSCDDGNPCTINDRCQNGTCTGDSDNPCDDSNPCNGVETCNPVSGVCVDGPPPRCNDNDACTADACDPNGDPQAGYCTHEPRTSRAVCEGAGTRAQRKLKDLKAVLEKTPREKIGGARWQKRLVAQVAATQKAIPAVATDAGLRKAAKRLRTFRATVGKLKKRGKMDPAVAETLLNSTDDVMKLLQG